MKSFKSIFVVVALLVASSAFAGGCNIPDQRGVPDDAMAQLRVQCEQALANATSVSGVATNLTNPDTIGAWGNVAKQWAEALGIAAKELGIAVDKFLDTDAGKLTAIIIIWKVLGESIAGIVIGVPLLIAVLVIGITTARRAKIRTIEYSETEKNWRGKPRVNKVTYFAEDETVMYWFAYVATILLSILVIACVIF